MTGPQRFLLCWLFNFVLFNVVVWCLVRGFGGNHIPYGLVVCTEWVLFSLAGFIALVNRYFSSFAPRP